MSVTVRQIEAILRRNRKAAQKLLAPWFAEERAAVVNEWFADHFPTKISLTKWGEEPDIPTLGRWMATIADSDVEGSADHAVTEDGHTRSQALDKLHKVILRGSSRALIAQAPAMTRVLLRVEWAGRQDYVGDGGYDCCSCCGGIAPDNERISDAVDDLATGKTVVGHRADCELANVLRAAGVRT